MNTREIGRTVVVGLGVLLLFGGPPPAAAQPLDRDPSNYHILARSRAFLKDYHLVDEGRSCNIGVNDAGGVLQTDNVTPHIFTQEVGQTVADDCTDAGGFVNQCFCNTSEQFDELCATWTPPILADESDATFIAACNHAMVGEPYPAAFIVGTVDVTCHAGTDCVPASADAIPGNGECDLKPGDYRMVNPKDGCTLALRGVYNVGDYRGDKGTTLEIPEVSTLNVAGEHSELVFGDGGRMVNLCGTFRINYRGGTVPSARIVNLGRANDGEYAMDICAPHAMLKLRNKNMLKGHFFADAVQSDFNNHGRCCDRGVCGCFDVVMPTSLPLGATLTLSGGCDLQNITQVLVCGVDCPILSRTGAQIVCTPQVAGPACTVDGVSTAGFFRSDTTVNVTP